MWQVRHWCNEQRPTPMNIGKKVSDVSNWQGEATKTRQWWQVNWKHETNLKKSPPCHCHLWLRTMVIHQIQAFDLLRTVVMNLKNHPGVEEGLSYSPVCVVHLRGIEAGGKLEMVEDEH